MACKPGFLCSLRFSPLDMANHLQSKRNICLATPILTTRLRRLSPPPHPRLLAISAGIQIDRHQYFEDLLRNQSESEAREEEANRACPLDCVREVRNYNEFEKILNAAEEANQLVMVDFYSPSCGACKYLLPQVVRLCKKGCEENCSIDEMSKIVYVKHNVRDEYDELTELASFYSVRTVPMFMFLMNGSPVQRLFTRDKQRLQQIVCYITGQNFDQ